MIFTSMPHFLTNLLCTFVWNKRERNRVRAVLNSPVAREIRFIRRDLGTKIFKIKTFVGYQGRSLLIAVNDQWIYKFPLYRSDFRELAENEKRIVDALQPISPIHIPSVELLYMGRDKIPVRKYEFVRGCGVRQLNPNMVLKHKTKLARQLANFLYQVACADPAEIRDLKPTPDDAPRYMYGWSQGDLCDNFFADPKTMQVVAIIDWEDAHFGDLSPQMGYNKNSPQRELMDAVRHEYDVLYKSGGKRVHRATAKAKQIH